MKLYQNNMFFLNLYYCLTLCIHFVFGKCKFVVWIICTICKKDNIRVSDTNGWRSSLTNIFTLCSRWEFFGVFWEEWIYIYLTREINQISSLKWLFKLRWMVGGRSRKDLCTELWFTGFLQLSFCNFIFIIDSRCTHQFAELKFSSIFGVLNTSLPYRKRNKIVEEGVVWFL